MFGRRQTTRPDSASTQSGRAYPCEAVWSISSPSLTDILIARAEAAVFTLKCITHSSYKLAAQQHREDDATHFAARTLQALSPIR